MYDLRPSPPDLRPGDSGLGDSESQRINPNNSSSLPSFETSPPLFAALTTFGIRATLSSASEVERYILVPFRTPCDRILVSTVSFVA